MHQPNVKSSEKVIYKMILDNSEEYLLESNVTIVFMEKVEVLLVLMVLFSAY